MPEQLNERFPKQIAPDQRAIQIDAKGDDLLEIGSRNCWHISGHRRRDGRYRGGCRRVLENAEKRRSLIERTKIAAGFGSRKSIREFHNPADVTIGKE